MDSLAAKNQSIIESPLFELFVKQYQSNLRKKGDDLFQVPSVLKDICKVIFLHNLKKSVMYESIPKDTIFVDDVDKVLKYLKPVIRLETRGYFNEVDKITETAMRNADFRSAIIAFFYLEGLWESQLCGSKPFYNSDGTIVEKVDYFGFDGVRVVVADGKLKANLNYVANHNKRIRDVVTLMMPVGPDYEEGIYENSLLLLPEVDLRYKHEKNEGYETRVIQFRYKHNEDGFKAIGFVCMTSSDGGGSRPRKTFILNKPFEIDIFFKSEKVLHVKVNNLFTKK